MSYLTGIFCNPEVTAGVKLTTQNVAEQHAGLTLAQCFVLGNSWNSKKVQENLESGMLDKLFDFYVHTWEYDDSSESLKDFKLYNSREIQNAWIRARFLKRMMKVPPMAALLLNDLKDSLESTDAIRDLSFHAFEYPSLLMPIKGFLCAHGLDESFEGLMANTSPVQAAVKRLYRQNIMSNTLHTEMCAGIGKEIGKDRMYVNTALWWIGQN